MLIVLKKTKNQQKYMQQDPLWNYPRNKPFSKKNGGIYPSKSLFSKNFNGIESEGGRKSEWERERNRWMNSLSDREIESLSSDEMYGW